MVEQSGEFSSESLTQMQLRSSLILKKMIPGRVRMHWSLLSKGMCTLKKINPSVFILRKRYAKCPNNSSVCDCVVSP